METIAGRMLREIGQRARSTPERLTVMDLNIAADTVRDTLGESVGTTLMEECEDNMQGFAEYCAKCADEVDALAAFKRGEGGQVPPQS